MFILTIGDWSQDGHGVSEDYRFRLEEGTTLDSLREVHFKLVDKYGSVDDYLQESADYREKLISAHFPDQLGEGVGENLALAWMGLLMEEDSTVKVTYVPDTTQRFHFYGKDKHGRHIESVGYDSLYW